MWNNIKKKEKSIWVSWFWSICSFWFVATHILASKTKAINNVFLQISVFFALYMEVSNVISAFISHSSEVTQTSKVILTLQWAALLKTKLLLSHILLQMLCGPLNSSTIKRSALWDDLQWYSDLYTAIWAHIFWDHLAPKANASASYCWNPQW